MAFDKPLDEEVQIGRHWVYGGRLGDGDYNATPKMFWKCLEFVQEDPYKEDAEGKKVYADYVETKFAPESSNIVHDTTTHTTTIIYNNTFSLTLSLNLMDDTSFQMINLPVMIKLFTLYRRYM